MRRYLCLHMPHLAPERARRDGASAAEAGRPLALTRPVGAAQVVVQICPRGAALGLRSGMTLGQAQALAPQLVAAPYDAVRDATALRELAHWAVQFSPAVEPAAPDMLVLDITGCGMLFGGEERLARQALTGLARLGFTARLGIADTRGAAWALAVAGRAAPALAPPGQTSAWLAPLPPESLRLEPATCATLERLGVRSVGDLLMLPRASLPARFGAALVLRIQQALGEVHEGLCPLPPEELPTARRTFEAPVADRAAVLHVAGELLAEVFGELDRQARGLRRLDCVLYRERQPPQVVAVGTARAVRDRTHLARLLAAQLERLDLAHAAPEANVRLISGVERFEPTPGVIGILLVARETTPWRPTQDDLFEPRGPGDDEALATLVDRLANRVGYGLVVRPQLVDDHQPEMAVRYASVAEVGCEAGLAGGATRPGAVGGPALPPAEMPANFPARPTRLLAHPAPIRVLALVPDGPPTWFVHHGREHVIARAVGPERIETAWWRGPDVRRDYFRVTTRTGEQFWIFHARDEHAWYLHGVFA